MYLGRMNGLACLMIDSAWPWNEKSLNTACSICSDATDSSSMIFVKWDEGLRLFMQHKLLDA